MWIKKSHSITDIWYKVLGPCWGTRLSEQNFKTIRQRLLRYCRSETWADGLALPMNWLQTSLHASSHISQKPHPDPSERFTPCRSKPPHQLRCARPSTAPLPTFQHSSYWAGTKQAPLDTVRRCGNTSSLVCLDALPGRHFSHWYCLESRGGTVTQRAAAKTILMH